MAGAYRPFDRVHAPLVSPLEDLNPATAHLKPEWASSFQRLQECLISSLLVEGRDYSANIPSTKNLNGYHLDELLVFNVYKTLHLSTAYGLGPNPCSPFYIFYPARHPADSMIQSSPAEPSSPGAEKFNSLSKKLWSNIKGLGGQASSLYNPVTKDSNTSEFSRDEMSHQGKSAPIRPNLIQSFLDRKDFSTRQSSTVASIRFYEEFIEWRLLPGPPILEKPSKNRAGVFTSEPVTPSKTAGEKASTNTPQDIPAAKIYLNPRLHLIIPNSVSSNSLTKLFTEKEDGELGRESVYTTLDELGSVESHPINVFFSDTGLGTKTYWWVSEDSSWRIVYDKTQDINISSKRHCPYPLTTVTDTTIIPPNQDDGKPTLDIPTHNLIFGKPKAEEKVTKMFPEVKGGCVKLYIANSDEPIAQVHLLTGQMWILKHLMLETIDIAVTVIFSVVNLERHIEDKHEEQRKKKKRPNRFSRVHSSN